MNMGREIFFLYLLGKKSYFQKTVAAVYIKNWHLFLCPTEKCGPSRTLQSNEFKCKS